MSSTVGTPLGQVEDHPCSTHPVGDQGDHPPGGLRGAQGGPLGDPGVTSCGDQDLQYSPAPTELRPRQVSQEESKAGLDPNLESTVIVNFTIKESPIFLNLI